jgi:flagellar basal-body rod protein FlgB
MGSRIDNAFFFPQRALDLRTYRQQVLAGNIANADTPHYKARDFDFAAALRQAVDGRDGDSLKVVRTHARHLEVTGDGGLPELKYRVPLQDAADGNTVEMDVERSEFAENALQYQASVAFVTHQVKMLTAAIAPQ